MYYISYTQPKYWILDNITDNAFILIIYILTCKFISKLIANLKASLAESIPLGKLA